MKFGGVVVTVSAGFSPFFLRQLSKKSKNILFTYTWFIDHGDIERKGQRNHI